MSSLWITPEQMLKKKRLKKKLTYISIYTGVAVLSALITFILK